MWAEGMQDPVFLLAECCSNYSVQTCETQLSGEQVQEGAELLSPADQEEKILLAKGGLPARWRLSCKTIVGKDNIKGKVRVKAVPQTEWRDQRKGTK